METRSKTRAGLTHILPEGVLEGPEPRPSANLNGDLGLATLLGDGDVPIVGWDQPEVGATTSAPRDIPVVSEWDPGTSCRTF